MTARDIEIGHGVEAQIDVAVPPDADGGAIEAQDGARAGAREDADFGVQ